ncbi:GNAT family N-acetyltransferase [Psychromonas aquimarina]|uniref:GNAT family N-acetyltransferase n=1 Tax=Psychromonas aquimarina TaxID=444919 RepID=UPI0004125A72|nr:GNAT family N-acetyltransferase [Psychromonas aquimarina]
MNNYKIREIIESDWPAIMRIQNEAYYSTAAESEDVLRSKHLSSPSTCIVCENSAGQVIGYGLAHAYPSHQAPQMGVVIAETITSNNLFIHDLAVEKKSQGQGLAKVLFNYLKCLAIQFNYSSLSLVAIQNADSFWSKMGFEPLTLKSLGPSYDKNASFMLTLV